jgi:hypothetical protein
VDFLFSQGSITWTRAAVMKSRHKGGASFVTAADPDLTIEFLD